MFLQARCPQFPLTTGAAVYVGESPEIQVVLEAGSCIPKGYSAGKKPCPPCGGPWGPPPGGPGGPPQCGG